MQRCVQPRGMHEDHTILKNHIHNENPKKTQEYLFANQFFRVKFESVLKIQENPKHLKKKRNQLLL